MENGEKDFLTENLVQKNGKVKLAKLFVSILSIYTVFFENYLKHLENISFLFDLQVL